MKKILAGLMAAATVASTAMGIDGSATATSANAVGFITFPAMEADQLVCITIPFVRVGSGADGDEEMDITELQFATDAPFASTIWTWNGMGWDPHIKDGDAGEAWEWDTPDEPLQAGQAIFFQPSEAMDSVILAGQVPADATCPVVIGENLGAIGNPYPVPLRMSESTLGTASSMGTMFHRWELQPNGKWGWSPVGMKDDDPGQPYADEDEDNPLVFAPGEGFFFDTRDAAEGLSDWEADKGYTWP